MSTGFFCFGFFALSSMVLCATLFNFQKPHRRDRFMAIVCLIVGAGLSSILTGFLALLLGA